MVVSDLGSAIEYLVPFDKPACEIGPGAENMAVVLTALFDTPDVRYVCNELQRANRAILEIDVDEFLDSGTNDRDTQAVSDDRLRRLIVRYASCVIDWEFSRRHYRMEARLNSIEQAEDDQHLQTLLDDLTRQCGASTALLVLGPVLRTRTVGSIVHTEWFKALSSGDALQAMLATRVDWVDDFEAVAMSCMQHPGIMASPYYRESIEKLVLSIPPFGGGDDIRMRLTHYIETAPIVPMLTTASRLRKRETYELT